MDPRLIELNPRIDDAAAAGAATADAAAADAAHAAERQAMASLAGGRSTASITATLAGTRKQVGRWLVGLGTALEGRPQGQPAGTARR